MDERTNRQEKEQIIISWSCDKTSYDSARKEWELVCRLDKKCQCALCGRQLEHPVLIRNRFNGQERVVGYVCCRDYITDVDSPDPEESFRKRLARVEQRKIVTSLEDDLEMLDKQSSTFTCPLTSKFPAATGDCASCIDPVTKRVCLHFFLYPEIGLAAYKNFAISEQRFLNILERIKIRAVEEFVRVASIISDPQCRELVDLERFHCTSKEHACERYGSELPCPHIGIIDSLHSLKRFVLRTAGPNVYKSALSGIFTNQSISIMEKQESSILEIATVLCPHTGVFPDRKNCPGYCSDIIAEKCEGAIHYLEGYRQAGGETAATLIKSIFAEQVKEKLGEWWQDTFSSSCALITDPMMSLKDCLKYRCYASRWSHPCPFAATGMPRHKSRFDNLSDIPSQSDYDDDKRLIEKRKRQYHLLRKIAIKRLTRQGYVELVSDRAGEGEKLATVLPIHEKQKAERQGLLLETAKMTGQKPGVLLAKARYDALCKKAGVPGLGQDNPFKWTEWTNDEILGDKLIKDLEETKLHDLAKDAYEINLIIEMFGDFQSFFKSLIEFYSRKRTRDIWKLLRQVLPQTFSQIKNSNLQTNPKKISHLKHGQILRWLYRGLSLKETEIINTIILLLQKPVSINELINMSLNEPSPGARVVYSYLLRFIGCYVHKDIVADNPGLGGHFTWCIRDKFWLSFFKPANGKEHVALERFIEALKAVGLEDVASDLGKLNKTAAEWRWRIVKRIYDSHCFRVGLRPLIMDRPPHKCTSSFSFGEPKDLHGMLEYARQEKLTRIIEDIDIIQRWKASRVEKRQIIIAWRESIGMTTKEFTVLADILEIDVVSKINTDLSGVDIKKLNSREWLSLASRTIKEVSIIKKLLQNPLTLKELKDQETYKDPKRAKLICEGIYAFICGNKNYENGENDNIDTNILLARPLIHHRLKWQGDMPIKVLARILKSSIQLSELIAFLKSNESTKLLRIS